MTPPRQPGIYLVTLTNTEPISVNADRARIADRCIKVTSANCKVGKARNLAARERDYQKTFGTDNVVFEVLAVVEEPERFEPDILRRLTAYRMRGQAGRPNEWLQGTSPDFVRTVVQEVLTGLDTVVRARPHPMTRMSRSKSSSTEPYTDPAETVGLLRRFRDMGFSDAHFSQIHHFWPSNRETIDRHSKYCEKTQKFPAGGSNAITQQRLSFVVDRLKEERLAGRHVGDKEFQRLAGEAWQAFPPRNTG